METMTTMNYTEDVWLNATNTTLSPYQEILDLHFGGVYIHPHYYQYLDYIISLPDIYFYLMGIYIGIVGMVGTLGNLLVIYIFCTTHSLRTPPNIFIINLAISDMGFSAINGFPLMTISSFARHWYFGKAGCTIYAMLGGLTGFNSIATLACISLDRFYVIAYPFDAMRKCTKKRALIQVMCVWIWSICLSFPPLFGFGDYIAEGVMIECSFDYISQDWLSYSYNYMIIILGFFLPVFVIILCYILIIRAVSAQADKMRAKAEKMGSDGAKTQKERQQNIQLAKIAAITISLFILSWTPYAIFAMAGNNGYTQWVTPTTTQIPVLFAKASATWNPILYALSHPKFRGVLEAKFPFLLMCKGSNIDKGEETSQVTETTKGKLGRENSSMSETSDLGNQEMSNGGGHVSRSPGGRNRNQETRFDGDDSDNTAVRAISGSDVNPRAMTRAANTIFSHLVTAYEGMRVLTTSGDGTGANKLDSAFSNPAFEGDNGHMMPPMGYYPQSGFMPMQAGSRPMSHSPHPMYAMPMQAAGMVPYPGYFPAQPAMGQGQMPGAQPQQTSEVSQRAVQPQQTQLSQPQVKLHPQQMQMHPQVHPHPLQVQVHQPDPVSHLQEEAMEKPPNNSVVKADPVTTEMTVNNPIPETEKQTIPQEDITDISPPEPTLIQTESDQNVNNNSSVLNEEVPEEGTTDGEDFPPPPEDFLHDMEGCEEGRPDTTNKGTEEAVNKTSAGSTVMYSDPESSTIEVKTEDDECPKEIKEGIITENNKITEGLRAVEEIDKVIYDRKLRQDATCEAVVIVSNETSVETDGEADGDITTVSHHFKNDVNREGDCKSLARECSIKYEEGFL